MDKNKQIWPEYINTDNYSGVVIGTLNGYPCVTMIPREPFIIPCAIVRAGKHRRSFHSGIKKIKLQQDVK